MAVPDAAATLAVFETREHRDRGEIAIGSLRLTPFAVRHGIPTFGCRVESDRGVLAYSADSGPSDALVELARAPTCSSARPTSPCRTPAGRRP